MRRKDREITDRNEIINIIKNCDVCRIALNDEEYPYILPLNFGEEITTDGKIILYFHGADSGKKYELIKKDCRASFEMDCSHKLVTDSQKGFCTMKFRSVIGCGNIELIEDETEKYKGLEILVKHYHKEDFVYNKEIVDKTTVFKLTVENITGKER